MRKAVIQIEDILVESIHQVYLGGLENFTPKKAALACRISEGSVYHYFPTKQDLLEQCMLYIMSQADDSLRGIQVNPGDFRAQCYNLWEGYYRYYVEHKEQAFFHQAYRNSSYFKLQSQDNLITAFPHMSSQLSQFHLEQKIPIGLFWIFVINNTLDFALRVSEGELVDSPQNTSFCFELLVSGIEGLLAKIRQTES